MKGLKKIHYRYISLFLPLAAVILGILIMMLQKPIVVQAGYSFPMPQSFQGEYSYDRINWFPLEMDSELNAMEGDLYLRGHFARDIPQQSCLYFYSDHIGSEIYIDGELRGIDTLIELAQYGIKLQPSMCCREWRSHYFEETVSAEALVEIHLKNPHTFGNKNAYKDFLNTLCCTANVQEHLAKNLVSAAQPYNVIGVILAIVGVLLLCSALVSAFFRLPIEIVVVQTGLLAVFAGGCFLLDTIDLCFRMDNHILSTYGWQICVMYSVHLLGTMARDLLEGKRKQAATYVMNLSLAADVVMILLSFAGVVLMYDTLRFWVMLQWVVCPFMMICCTAELFTGNKKHRADFVVFLMMFASILLDCMGVMSSIYSRAVLTKATVLLLFLLKLVQFARNIIANYKASGRAHKLEKELEESRIAIMLSQIHPHFIFNALGTIRGLCREDPDQAWRALGDFSAYLRANMNALTNEKSIPFAMELAHVEAYLRLEQMRMGERLNVVYDIQYKDFFIPPLMLQPLVENAVKHGLFYKADGGTVVIRSRYTDGRIILTVEDDGLGFEVSAQNDDFHQRQHHGLENVRSRIEKMLGGSLQVKSYPEHGSMVTLEFPVDRHL